MSDPFSLKGRIVLLTGASRGLGRDMAFCLAEAGATVLCAGRTVKELEATAAAIRRRKGKAHVTPIDITDERSAEAQVQAIIRRHRRIDVLVNNAGVIHRANIVDTPTPDFRKVVETDLIGQFVLAREVGRHMLARRYGRIVNIASIMGILGRASVAGYVAAKHGLIGLTKVTALETAEQGITCNAICPGYVHTPLVDMQIADQAKAHGIPREQVIRDVILAPQPTKQFVTIEQAAALALYLTSDAAASITGTALPIDGGWTAR
jgi:3-hydroxybutyrate dehydrogenase